ncbi:hypothetical protein EW146_g296 [Bondarzewia mesenterica]|uniref:Uncharacterized protein n=1 Tax=Bondarzewia mesenterica TaxID=1095465 RepID=A0A4S4M7Y7_9AGAM|nr:hypothetical protein EW146_g296 [Bondarzewia mesenterica]
MDTLPITLCAMATTASDQRKVRDLAERWPDKVVPAFGETLTPQFHHFVTRAHISIHPVAQAITLGSHIPSPSPLHPQRKTITALSGSPHRHPNPLKMHYPVCYPPSPHRTSSPDLLSDLRANLSALPNAMLGEVGIDRAARVPFPSAPSPSPSQPCCSQAEPPNTDTELESYPRRELSPFITPLAHQLAILEAEIAIAVELRRNISIHTVKAPQPTRELLDRMSNIHGHAWRRISVDLHSCGLSPQIWVEIEKRHPNVFLSLSTAINSRSPNHRALIAVCAPSRLLAESDYCNVRHCTQRTWDMVRIVAEVKGWRVEHNWSDEYEVERETDESAWGVVRRLEENWRSFVKGGHKPVAVKSSRKGKWDDWGNNESESGGEA